MAIRLFLCGDVMTGRGIDQILAHPGDPRIAEPYVQNALEYVALAEAAHGPIPRRVAPAYIWGDALGELEAMGPAARIVNLETAVTTSEERAEKGINYRMHPANADCLAAARIDCCTLANNHVLDWGASGLLETLDTLAAAGIAACGAGRDAEEAQAPAIVPLARSQARLLVFSFACASSGVPRSWDAGASKPGVWLLEDLGPRTVERIARRVGEARRPGDLVIASIHWGANWGYEVSAEEQRFARALVDAGVDLVHGHSSHHPKGIEVYRGRLILYGCGDLINDYEGIDGYGEFRGELGLMYFAALEASGALAELRMSAATMRKFQVRRAADPDARWLCGMLRREGRRFGTGAELARDGRIELRF